MNKQKPSPSGLGIYAKNEKLKTVKKGADGQKWIVYKDCNGVKKWKLYKKNKKGGAGNNKTTRANETNTGRFDKEQKPNTQQLNNNSIPTSPLYLRKNNSVGPLINFNKFSNLNQSKKNPSLKHFFIYKIEEIKNSILIHLHNFRIDPRIYFFKSKISINQSNSNRQYVLTLLRNIFDKFGGCASQEEIIHVTIHDVLNPHSLSFYKKGIHFKLNENLSYKQTGFNPKYFYIPIFLNNYRQLYIKTIDHSGRPIPTMIDELTYDHDRIACKIFINDFLFGMNTIIPGLLND